MFLSPKFWGCKYTNNFLFINKNPVFQHFEVLITMVHPCNSLKNQISSSISRVISDHAPAAFPESAQAGAVEGLQLQAGKRQKNR